MESVTLAAACPPPANGYLPVTREVPAASRTRLRDRHRGLDRAPGVAASASRMATWTFITPGPAWSTIWYLLASASYWSDSVEKVGHRLTGLGRHLRRAPCKESHHVDYYLVVPGKLGRWD